MQGNETRGKAGESNGTSKLWSNEAWKKRSNEARDETVG
jgi:hypothetical protein